MMSPFLAAAFGLFMYMLVRLLNITQPSAAPLIYAKDRSSQFVQSVLDMCPILHQPYVPPLFWGKSGHIQTAVYQGMGRFNITVPDGVRHSKIMPDGAHLTFDLYEPTQKHPSGDGYCILLCPGIGNNSESAYIQSLVHHAQHQGYIAVVLNHLGSLKNLPITSPRIFSYGGTDELAAVRAEIERIHPSCKIVLVGCSMGANVVVKYLGEDRAHQQGILAAISVNQGYNVCRAMPLMKMWRNFGHFYVYVMCENQKRIIRAHREQLLSEETKKKYGIDEKTLFSSTSIDQLDDAFFRKLFGFDNLTDYYETMSSYRYLPNIQVPLLILNAEDDPVVPPQLLEHPMDAAKSQPNTLFVVTKHGGHLGFYEKGMFKPSEHTWMDRLILQYSNAITKLHKAGELPMPLEKSNVYHTMNEVNEIHHNSNGHIKNKICPAEPNLEFLNSKLEVEADIENHNEIDGLKDMHDKNTEPLGEMGDIWLNGTGRSVVSNTGSSLCCNESREFIEKSVHLDRGDILSNKGLVLETLKKNTNSASM